MKLEFEQWRDELKGARPAWIDRATLINLAKDAVGLGTFVLAGVALWVITK